MNPPVRRRQWATTVDGRQLWDREFTNRIPQQVAADARGGLVLVFASETVGGVYYPPVIRRMSGRTGTTSWEYVLPGGQGPFSEVAIHPDGMVFVAAAQGLSHTSLVGIGPNGAARAWRLLPDGAGGLLIAHRKAPWVSRLSTDNVNWYANGTVDLLPVASSNP